MASSVSQESVKLLRDLVEEAVSENGELAISYKNIHQGNPNAVLGRFLKARDGNVQKAYKMLVDCLYWRVDNDIDGILSRPIEPKEMYDTIRQSQLIGMTGFCKKGRPVFALAVGPSSLDKAPVDKYVQSHIQINEYRDRVLLPQSTKRMGHFVGTCLKIIDMTNLKFSALNRIKILTLIATVDDLNYPEKTDVYYIVNAPYIFSACWKVVKPLLQERTKRKVQVLQGSGREELLKVMDVDVLPYFVKYDSKNLKNSRPAIDCFSSSDAFHMDLWNYMKQQLHATKCIGPIPQKSYHVEVPEPIEQVHTIETAIETALVQFSDDSMEASTSFCVLDLGGDDDG